MRLAISNISWDVQEDLAVAKLLAMFAVDAIDVAPGKYFPDPTSAKDADIENVRQWWADHGSLQFGAANSTKASSRCTINFASETCSFAGRKHCS